VQQTIVDRLQTDVDSLDSGSSSISNTDALLYQMELDEIDASKALRTTQIAAIDAL